MTKSSQSEAKRITIGKVGAPHGIKSEIRIIPLTDFPERFSQMTKVMVGDEMLTIDSVKPHGKFYLMRFREYKVREDLMLLTGKKLTVTRAELAPLAEGEYYVFDIIGLAVFDEDDNSLGTVENIIKTGSNDVYQVKAPDGTELLIPALKKVVKSIDLKNGKIIVDLFEEMP